MTNEHIHDGLIYNLVLYIIYIWLCVQSYNHYTITLENSPPKIHCYPFAVKPNPNPGYS